MASAHEEKEPLIEYYFKFGEGCPSIKGGNTFVFRRSVTLGYVRDEVRNLFNIPWAPPEIYTPSGRLLRGDAAIFSTLVKPSSEEPGGYSATLKCDEKIDYLFRLQNCPGVKMRVEYKFKGSATLGNVREEIANGFILPPEKIDILKGSGEALKEDNEIFYTLVKDDLSKHIQGTINCMP